MESCIPDSQSSPPAWASTGTASCSQGPLMPARPSVWLTMRNAVPFAVQVSALGCTCHMKNSSHRPHGARLAERRGLAQRARKRFSEHERSARQWQRVGRAHNHGVPLFNGGLSERIPIALYAFRLSACKRQRQRRAHGQP